MDNEFIISEDDKKDLDIIRNWFKKANKNYLIDDKNDYWLWNTYSSYSEAQYAGWIVVSRSEYATGEDFILFVENIDKWYEEHPSF